MDKKLRRFLRAREGQLTLAALLILLLLVVAVGRETGFLNLAGTAITDKDAYLARVSVSSIGAEGNQDSFSPVIASDGRTIAFLSTADNLVKGDENGVQDVFLYTVESGGIQRLSVDSSGAEANGPSENLAFSSDGRVAAFSSTADNLVAGDGNGVADIFVSDVLSDTVQRISLSVNGEEGNDRSIQPALSADGRIVAFVSLADNLVPGDVNGVADIFVYDRATATLTRVSRNGSGEEANGTSKHPALSADGRYVAFQSRASNLTADSDNGVYDVFLFDREQGAVELISRGMDGGAADQESQLPALSADGRYVAFESWASNLVAGDRNPRSDVFVYDRQTEMMELISQTLSGEPADNVNGGAAISTNGRYVAFASLAALSQSDANLTYDVYLYDRLQKDLVLASVTPQGIAGNGASISPSLAHTGRYVTFDSTADNLVQNDHNDRVDVFVFNPRPFSGDYSVYLPALSR